MEKNSNYDYYWVGAAEGWNWDKNSGLIEWDRDINGKHVMKSRLCGSFAQVSFMLETCLSYRGYVCQKGDEKPEPPKRKPNVDPWTDKELEELLDDSWIDKSSTMIERW